MALKISKAQAKEMLSILVAEGYDLIDQFALLDRQARQSANHQPEITNVKYKTALNEWSQRVEHKLENVFPGLTEITKFKRAKPNGFVRAGTNIKFPEPLAEARVAALSKIIEGIDRELDEAQVPFYLKKEWWATVVTVPLTIALFIWWLQSGKDSNAAVQISRMNGGVVNTQSNIGKQEIYYADRADPNYENSRNENLIGLEGKELIRKWFDLIAEQDWRGACSLMSKNDCDAGNWESINAAFHFMKERTLNGYEDPQILHAANAPLSVWCVKYHYTMAQTGFARKIVEIMQYKLNRREDGAEEITTKLCEKQWMEGKGETKCVNPSVFYCRDLQW